MTTNKPGTVTQQPLFGCTSCYEECTYPADHLHVYNGECWCESCWGEIADWRDWLKLEPFRPALKADYERLQAETERLQAECEKLRRRARSAEREYSKVARTLKGLERVSKVVSDHSDEACTENNQLRVECEQLRKDAERYRWLRDPCSGAERVVMYGRGDYGRGLMAYTMLDEAIDAAMQESEA